MVVFENLRSIYEPFNKPENRRFDTFNGYENFSEHDKESDDLKKILTLHSTIIRSI